VWSIEAKRALIDVSAQGLSISRQCSLLGLSRSTFLYEVKGESPENLLFMRLLDEQYTATPFYGVLRMTAQLRALGHEVNEKRIRRLLRLMALEAIYPKPNLSAPIFGHRVFPYLLRKVTIARVNQVWSTDITYIRMKGGFVYLTAVIDWYSRYVLSWRVSITLEGSFCVDVVAEALLCGCPEVFNTDQGSQYTTDTFTAPLLKLGISVSMDGRNRALDNIFVERLWRTVKYELIYLNEYSTIKQLVGGIREYFEFYNQHRLHQSLDYCTPAEIYKEQSDCEGVRPFRTA
jgi:putative transposase